jgi:hypothetical protein
MVVRRNVVDLEGDETPCNLLSMGRFAKSRFARDLELDLTCLGDRGGLVPVMFQRTVVMGVDTGAN